MPRIAILSDLHGNISALRAVVEDISSRGPSRILCLGDVASYNSGQEECMQMLDDLSIEWIAGNHDLIAAGILEPVNCSVSAYYAAMRARERLSPRWAERIANLPLLISDGSFVAFHASPFAVDEYLTRDDRLARAAARLSSLGMPNIAFFGHTHRNAAYRCSNDRVIPVPGEKLVLESSSRYLINVGSAGEPRDGDHRASYVEYDTDTRTVQFRRLPIDFEQAWRASVDGRWRLSTAPGARMLGKARHVALRLRRRFFPRATDDSTLDAIMNRQRVISRA